MTRKNQKENTIKIIDEEIHEGAILRSIVLNRPDALHALSRTLVLELAEALDHTRSELEKSPASLRCLILRSEGKAFCVGADLKERAEMSESEVRDFLALMNRTFTSLAELPIPSIALLSGYALGGGLELALCADFRLAASDFPRPDYLGLPETSLGIIPGAGGTQRLSRIVGLSRAKELILTARRFSAQEALQMGLVQEVLPGTELVPRARDLAQRLSCNAPIALRAAKESLERGWGRPIQEALRIERDCYGQTLSSQDRLEALKAFREKRTPLFQGK